MRKKLLSILALLCLTVTSAWAQNPGWVQDGDEWDATTKTLTVNSDLSSNAYDSNGEIEHVIISSGVRSIGYYAFYAISCLTSVTIGNSVEYIGGDTFYCCKNITDVYCYPNAADLTWDEDGDDFKDGGSTVCHVHADQLSAYESKFNGAVNVTFVGDLPYDVTANLANGAYWATFYSNAGNYQAPVGTQVFAVNLDGTTITMIPVSDRIVKSDEGVVLKQETTSTDLTTTITMTLTETDANDSYFSDNSLTGTMTQINTAGANDYYVLGGKNGAGFYKLSNTSGTIGANKAYLTYSGGGAAAARGYFLFDEATGIEMPTAESNDFDGTVYDLQGRRVVNPTKGLYIVNGKKVFINK